MAKKQAEVLTENKNEANIELAEPVSKEDPGAKEQPKEAGEKPDEAVIGVDLITKISILDDQGNLIAEQIRKLPKKSVVALLEETGDDYEEVEEAEPAYSGGIFIGYKKVKKLRKKDIVPF